MKTDNTKSEIIWKGFRFGNLLKFDSGNQYPYSQKQLDIVEEKDAEHDVAVVVQSGKNNGIVGYISRNEENKKYIFSNSMTFSINFGICFYHPYDYIIPGANGGLFEVTPQNEKLSEKIKENVYCNLFISKIVNKICSKSIYNWQWKPNSSRVSMEIILLPCLEVSENDEYIWEENGRYYTLATNYISYLYLTGRMNKYQKLIDTYTYTY